MPFWIPFMQKKCNQDNRQYLFVPFTYQSISAYLIHMVPPLFRCKDWKFCCSRNWHCSFMDFWREFQKKREGLTGKEGGRTVDLEDSKQFLFHMTLWLILLHHHTKFGNNVLWFRRHHRNNSPDVTPCSWLGSKNQLTHPDKYSMTFLTFGVTLILNAVTLFFPQDTLADNAVIPNLVWLQTDQQFGRYSRNSHVLII